MSGKVDDVLSLMDKLGPEKCRELGKLLLDCAATVETDKVAEIVNDTPALMTSAEAAALIGQALHENGGWYDILRLGSRMLRLSAEKVGDDGQRTAMLNGALLAHALTGVMLEVAGHPEFIQPAGAKP